MRLLLAAFALLVLTTGQAAAVSVTVTPSRALDTLRPGDPFSLVLGTSSHFPESIAGVLTLSYDASILTYVGANFPDPPFDLVNDQAAAAIGATGPTTINDISFGSFLGSFGPNQTLGTLDFLAADAGFSQIVVALGQTGFTPLDLFEPNFSPTFPAALDAQVVPLPAAGWLLLSALAWLVAFRRQARLT